MSDTKHIYQPFLTDDFVIQDFDFEKPWRYRFTSCLKSKDLNPQDYGDFKNDAKFAEWAHDNLSFEERYQVPMMTSVYYYPSYVLFSEEDRYKTASAITLFYDIELRAWAVGMTGGGMNLAPHLLDTFIRLEKGIPFNIAQAISKDYSGYISKANHQENCLLLAQTLQKKATGLNGLAKRLL